MADNVLIIDDDTMETRLINWLTTTNRALSAEVEKLKIENNRLKGEATLIHERKVVAEERVVLYGRL